MNSYSSNPFPMNYQYLSMNDSQTLPMHSSTEDTQSASRNVSTQSAPRNVSTQPAPRNVSTQPVSGNVTTQALPRNLTTDSKQPARSKSCSKSNPPNHQPRQLSTRPVSLQVRDGAGADGVDGPLQQGAGLGGVAQGGADEGIAAGLGGGGSVGVLGHPAVKVSFGPSSWKASQGREVAGLGGTSLLKSRSTPNLKPKQFYRVNPESYVNVQCEAVNRDTR